MHTTRFLFLQKAPPYENTRKQLRNKTQLITRDRFFNDESLITQSTRVCKFFSPNNSIKFTVNPVLYTVTEPTEICRHLSHAQDCVLSFAWSKQRWHHSRIVWSSPSKQPRYVVSRFVRRTLRSAWTIQFTLWLQQPVSAWWLFYLFPRR